VFFSSNTFNGKMGYGAPITGSNAHEMVVRMLNGIKRRAEKMSKFANIKIRLEMLKKLEKNYF